MRFKRLVIAGLLSSIVFNIEAAADKELPKEIISAESGVVTSDANPDSAEIYDITINNGWMFSAMIFSDKSNYYIENKFLPSDLLGLIPEKHFTFISDKKYLSLPKTKVVEENLDYLRVKFALNEDYFISKDVVFRKEKARASHPIDAAYLNYDFNVPLEEIGSTRGFFELTYASKNDWKVKNSYIWDSKEFVRLSSFWVKSYDQGRLLTIGDTSTATTSNFGSSNIFGFKYSTAYFTQSSAVLDSLPVMTLKGFTENPTRLDLFINNQKVQQTEIEAGRYNLKIPYKTSGYGLAEAYVYDITGKPVIVSVPFYNSMEMLRPGAQEYEVSGGIMRQNYGIESFNYDGYTASGVYKLGITDWYTQDLYAQYSDFFWSASATGHFTPIKRLGVINAGYSINSEGQSLASLGVNRSSAEFSLGFNIQRSMNDEYFCFGFYSTCIKNEYRAYAGMALPYKLGSLNYNYIKRETFDDVSSVQNLQYVKQLNNRVGFFATYNDTKGTQKNKTGYIGLSLNLDGMTANSSITSNTNDTNYQMGLYKSESSKNPEYGFGSLTFNKSNTKTSENLYYGARLSKLNYQLNLYRDQEDSMSNLNLAGGAVYIPEENFVDFTKPIQSGIALVKVKNLTEPIRIDHENRFSGYTNKKGFYLVPSATALNNERVTVDINHLPEGVTMDSYKSEYFVPASGAVRIDFEAKPLPFVINIKGVQSGSTFNIGENFYVIGDDGEASVDSEGKAVIPLTKNTNCELNIKKEQKDYSCLKT